MEDERERICRGLGFSGIAEVHQVIVEAVQGDVTALRDRGLNAETLEQLGYTAGGLRRLGCSDEQLGLLGSDEPGPSGESLTGLQVVKDLLARETSCGDLRERGITAHHCRTAGADVNLLKRLGFPLAELVRAYSIQELRRAGHGVRDLSTHFNDAVLRAAGFSAVEMRIAGRSVRDLQMAGYNENHIRTAGFSVNELAMAGLTRQVRDHLKGQ